MKKTFRRYPWNFKDLTGQKFGKLTILSLHGRDKVGDMLWECECECGRIKYIKSRSLNSGNSKSCGICVRSGENNHNFVKKIKVNCEFCDKVLERTPSVAKKYKMFFCNLKCRSKYVELIPKEEHFNWKGGRDYKYRIKNLSNSYIRLLIKASNKRIENKDIPISLVNLVREKIKTQRYLKELTS